MLDGLRSLQFGTAAVYSNETVGLRGTTILIAATYIRMLHFVEVVPQVRIERVSPSGRASTPGRIQHVSDGRPATYGYGASAPTIVIHRHAEGWQDRFRAYRILLDGRPVAKIKRGESYEFPVAPGEHTILLTSAWYSSRPAHVELRKGERATFVCGPGGKFGDGPGTTVFSPGSYIALERIF